VFGGHIIFIIIPPQKGSDITPTHLSRLKIPLILKEYIPLFFDFNEIFFENFNISENNIIIVEIGQGTRVFVLCFIILLIQWIWICPSKWDRNLFECHGTEHYRVLWAL
jgi:hypothetical protein